MRIAIPLAALLLAVPACKDNTPADKDDAGRPYPARAYVDGPAGLRDLWSDILRACQRDERQRVHDLMASMMMTEADLVALFGEERGRYLAPRYQPMISKVVNAGSMELVALVYERKLDDIEVVAASPTGNQADRATLATIKPGTAVYNVRVKKKQEKLGLRYEFFVFRNGRWLTGNQLARYLPAPPDDGGTRD